MNDLTGYAHKMPHPLSKPATTHNKPLFEPLSSRQNRRAAFGSNQGDFWLLAEAESCWPETVAHPDMMHSPTSSKKQAKDAQCRLIGLTTLASGAPPLIQGKSSKRNRRDRCKGVVTCPFHSFYYASGQHRCGAESRYQLSTQSSPKQR